ncbi:DUF4926 domain-containing protein [Pseudaquidulcibacter saccharophilus]|uniref:DUF4926 domain-containing protein n=1 Tax=Pseudaquidulcibacter saccharophilus TaxID=2831900 RepID=UPI001EFF50B2|nr:DUF4926 domain-containing protein [Pseudaquidulcibacter saccharophilus]
MNKFSLYDVVKLVDSKSETSVPINSIGTIVDINDNYPNSYMVEFFNEDDDSLGVFDVISSQIIQSGA